MARLETWQDPYARGRPLFLAVGIRASMEQPGLVVETLRHALAAGLQFGVGLHASSELRPLWNRRGFQELLSPR